MKGIRRLSLMLLVLILPLLLPLQFNSLLVNNASASSCSVESGEHARFDEHLRNVSVNSSDNYFSDMEELSSDEKPRGRQWDQPLMQENTPLLSLDKGFHTSFVVENGTSSGVQMNLTLGKRYTFCITVDDINANGTTNPKVDAYLFTSSDFSTYSDQYLYLNGDDRQWMADLEENIPVEWRGGLWRTFRDSNDYENIRETDFSVVLDKLEIHSSFLSETSYEEFVILIDAIDNAHIQDAPAPHATILVDLTVMVEDAFILPTWTVPLTCMTLILLLIAVPVVMHFKHAKAGMNGIHVDLVPSMDKKSEEESLSDKSKDNPL
ncbi:MAG: hypothetical protein ACKVHH_05235 [Candidatus Poseidoniales archaeon]